MAFPVGLAISGLMGLSGLFGKPKPQTQTSNSTTTQNINQSSLPQYDATTLSARDQILGRLMENAFGGPDVYNNMVSQGMNAINQTESARGRILNNLLTQSGFGRSPSSAYARAAGENYRLGQQSQFLTQAPMQYEQLMRQRMQDLSSFFSGLPVGQQQTGTNTSTTNSTGVSDPNVSGFGSAIGSAGTMAGYLMGNKGKDWWK